MTEPRQLLDLPVIDPGLLPMHSLPRYKSHKTVRAVQIAGISHKPNPDLTGKSGASSYGATLYPAEAGHAQFDVSAEYMNKHQPKVGGYYVLYEDGYASYSPAKAFEEGYAPEAPSIDKLPGYRWSRDRLFDGKGQHCGGLVSDTSGGWRAHLGAWDLGLYIDERHARAVVEAEEARQLSEMSTTSDANEAEQAIVAAGANVAPRVTDDRLASVIASEHYFTAADGQMGVDRGYDPANQAPGLSQLTFCVQVLRNGFTITGESACASPENFNAEIGRRIARENAVAKIWPLEGYLLRQRLHEGFKS